MGKANLEYGTADFVKKVLALHVEEFLKEEVTGSFQARRLRSAATYRLGDYRRGFRSFYFCHPRDRKQWLFIVRLF